MTRSELKEKMKEGPPLTMVADLMGISRPTLYRHMEYYMRGEDSKIGPNLREYFDKVMIGKFKTEQDALKELEQIRFLIEGETAKAKEDLENDWDEFRSEYRLFDRGIGTMSSDAVGRKMKELERRRADLETRARELGLDPRFPFEEEGEPAELRWNEGEIRSACVYSYEGFTVFVDAEFERCREITVEAIAKVSGEDFVFARVKPEENARFAVMKMMMDVSGLKYRLKWNEGDRVKYAGPFPMRSGQY